MTIPPSEPERSCLGAGPLGAHLGRSWELALVGVILELPWAFLGDFSDNLGAIFGQHKFIGSEKASGQRVNDTPSIFGRFGFLGASFGRLLGNLKLSCGGLEASWRHLGSYIEPSWAMLCHLQVILGYIRQSWDQLVQSL